LYEYPFLLRNEDLRSKGEDLHVISAASRPNGVASGPARKSVVAWKTGRIEGEIAEGRGLWWKIRDYGD